MENSRNQVKKYGVFCLDVSSSDAIIDYRLQVFAQIWVTEKCLITIEFLRILISAL